jgi:hypothetical protein
MTYDLEELFDAEGRTSTTGTWDLDGIIRQGRRKRSSRRVMNVGASLAATAALIFASSYLLPGREVNVAPAVAPDPYSGHAITTHDVVDGIDFMITGPAVFNADHFYPLTVTVTNTNSTKWIGWVGAGIHIQKRIAPNPNYLMAGGNLQVDGVSQDPVTGLMEPHWEGLYAKVALEPGSSSVVRTTISSNAHATPFKGVSGWQAVAWQGTGNPELVPSNYGPAALSQISSTS